MPSLAGRADLQDDHRKSCCNWVGWSGVGMPTPDRRDATPVSVCMIVGNANGTVIRMAGCRPTPKLLTENQMLGSRQGAGPSPRSKSLAVTSVGTALLH